MASTEFSLEAANKSLSEEGFFALEDSVVGEGILEMEKRGFEYFSEYGLDFCKQHVLNEVSRTNILWYLSNLFQRIIPIVESFFGDESCVLGHWLRYKAHPGHILCFTSLGGVGQKPAGAL
jgi:hypothetical protein